MRTLSTEEQKLVAGGNYWVAAGIGLGIYNGGAMFMDSTNTYNAIGSRVGEYVFNSTHPDQLGPMNFPK